MSLPPAGTGARGQDGSEGESEEEEALALQRFLPYIRCGLCFGFLIDASTITECLHTFCKSCIVKHFFYSNRCPTCSAVVHQTQPLYNIRPDRQLQDIVYKMVPHLEACKWPPLRQVRVCVPLVTHPGVCPQWRDDAWWTSTGGGGWRSHIQWWHPPQAQRSSGGRRRTAGPRLCSRSLLSWTCLCCCSLLGLKRASATTSLWSVRTSGCRGRPPSDTWSSSSGGRWS
ncbi:polycomb group RING finger protein 6 isoform X3 [Antennarius striatus]|uniref:polycomb group RING finger protein 6 isoform X3 n=1 Tax=Antennarius striatus TaxID=241820 RepID=UPI0035B46162